MPTVTLHNLSTSSECYELTAECICPELPGVPVNTAKGVRSLDGKPSFAWAVKVYPPTITIPARSKVAGLPSEVKNAPAIKAAIAAKMLRISEDGTSRAAAKSGVKLNTVQSGK
jgi:hypothetical protein